MSASNPENSAKHRSKERLAALAFSPIDLEYLRTQKPFQLMLKTPEDNLEVYEALCTVGQLLLRKRQLGQTDIGCELLGDLLMSKRMFGPEMRRLLERAEMNIRNSKALVAQTRLLICQSKGITDRVHWRREQLKATLDRR